MLSHLDAGHLQHDFITYFLYPPSSAIIPFTVLLPPKHHLTKGCVIDLETTGLDPDRDNIISLGILQGKRAVIHQLTRPDYQQFRRYCTNKAKHTRKPRYAYNTRFETEFLNIKDDWHDLTQHAERTYEDWERGSYYTMHLDQCTFSVFKEPDIIGADVPPLWQEWLNTHKPETLFQIVSHNLADLLRTRQLIER